MNIIRINNGITHRLWLVSIAVIFVAVLLEGLSLTVSSIAPRFAGERGPLQRAIQQDAIQQLLKPEPDSLTRFDTELGWANRSNLDGPINQTNSLGMRERQDYARLPENGAFRISAYGDSYVFGSEVSTPDAWASLVEATGTGFQVLNNGVPEYGLDQAYMLFQKRQADFAGDVVLIGFTPDMFLNLVSVNSFYRTRSGFSVKPRFVFSSGGELQKIPNPIGSEQEFRALLSGSRSRLDSLGEHDYWYDPSVYTNMLYDQSATIRLLVTLSARVHRRYIDPNRPMVGRPGRARFNTDSEAFRLLMAITDRWVGDIRQRKMLPIIVLFPDAYSVDRVRKGLDTRYEPYRSALSKRGYPHLDLVSIFTEKSRVPLSELFTPGHHMTARGNKIVADYLTKQFSLMREQRLAREK
jgi:hypothetical protein